MTSEEFFKRYTYNVIRDRIGGGGFGTVYKTYDKLLHREVAIKVSEVKTTADGKKTFSLKDEFEALSHVPKHPNIANYEEFYSFETQQGVFDYAVMQYYPDGNLTQAIKEGLTDEQKEEVAMQLLEGIDFLHKHKVVHRDLKPGNILIVKYEGSVVPLITDFGLSKSAETGDGSQFSNSFGGGTQRYSSPEQLQGKPLRFNTDLWSYGAIVYELFMGEQLFSPGSGASNIAQAELEVYNKIIHGDVSKLGKMPERWRKVAEKCMVVDPEKRVKTAEELLVLLKGYEEATAVEGVANTTKTIQVGETLKSSNENTMEVTEKDSSSGNGKKKKGLWIGLVLAAVAVLLFLLFMPNAETKAFKSCQTVEDYRNYMAVFDRNSKQYNAKHYIEAERIVANDEARLENEDRTYFANHPDSWDLSQIRSGKYKVLVKAIKEQDIVNMVDFDDTNNPVEKKYNNQNWYDIRERLDSLKKMGQFEMAKEAIKECVDGDIFDLKKLVEELRPLEITFSVQGVSFVMKRVEGGTFQMGSNDSDADSDEKPVHSVTVSSFYMGETEVTQALWKAVMGSNPSYFKGDNLPVEQVSWNDIQGFLKKLNQMTGQNFRLPTEAEWEYAARGGRKGNGYKYAGSNTIGNVAVYDENSYNKGSSSPEYGTHRVKSKQANELGLYDMSGNVWEWCSDRYGNYSSSASNNPKGPSSGSSRVLRGGGWLSNAWGCRVSDRRYSGPDSRYNILGFRLVLP